MTQREQRTDPDLVGSARPLAALVEHRPRSIVSRTLLQKETGTVTLFAFDEGQGLSEHTAPFDALVTVLEGTAEVTIAGKAHRLEAGDGVIMPANKPHAVAAPASFKMMLVMIRS